MESDGTCEQLPIAALTAAPTAKMPQLSDTFCVFDADVTAIVFDAQGLCDCRCGLWFPLVARDHPTIPQGARLLRHLAES